MEWAAIFVYNNYLLFTFLCLYLYLLCGLSFWISESRLWVRQYSFGRVNRIRCPVTSTDTVKQVSIRENVLTAGKLEVSQTTGDINAVGLYHNLITVLYPDVTPHWSSIIIDLYHKPDFLTGGNRVRRHQEFLNLKPSSPSSVICRPTRGCPSRTEFFCHGNWHPPAVNIRLNVRQFCPLPENW